MLHSLPLEFPLAMAFAEQLLSWKSEDGEGKSEDEPDTIPTPVLLQVVELLGEASPPWESGALGVREELVRWAGGVRAATASCQVAAMGSKLKELSGRGTLGF